MVGPIITYSILHSSDRISNIEITSRNYISKFDPIEVIGFRCIEIRSAGSNIEFTYSIRLIGARIELWFGAIPAIKNIKEMQSKSDHGNSRKKYLLGFHDEITYSIRSIGSKYRISNSGEAESVKSKGRTRNSYAEVYGFDSRAGLSSNFDIEIRYSFRSNVSNM